jgi:hypothetical protein
MVAVIVHYFGTAPLMKVMTQKDPSESRTTCRPAGAVLDFISAALFQPERSTVGRRVSRERSQLFLHAARHYFSDCPGVLLPLTPSNRDLVLIGTVD